MTAKSEAARFIAPAGALIGLGLALWLVWTYDAGAVERAFLAEGPLALAGITSIRVAIVAMCGAAWSIIILREVPGALSICVRLRFVREAVNVLLPVGSVGGDVLGARLLALSGVPAGTANASIIVDLLLQLTGQALFVLLGVILLARLGQSEGAVPEAAGGFALALIPLLGFFAAQRAGATQTGRRLLDRLARRFPVLVPGSMFATQAALQMLWRQPRPLWMALAIHFAAWLVGTGEVYIALGAMGETVSIGEAAALESLVQALKSAVFVLPGGLGVQEGGFVLIGSLFNISPEAALAVSLAKRVPDILIGLPGLWLWHIIEKRHAKHRRQHQPSERVSS